MRSRFVLRRICWTLFILIASTVVIFGILRVIPGDPARAMLGPEATPDAIAVLRAQLGLDEPLIAQYAIWVSHAIRGDLGQSIALSQSVVSLLAERLPITLLLSLYALVFAVLIAIPVSVISATHRHTVLDHGPRFVALLGLAMPSFWLGIMLVLVFGLWLQVLPVYGYASPSDGIIEHLQHVLLPAVALGLAYAAMIMETNRTGLIEVLHQDYIRTARAAGLSNRLILYKYALRNALVPTVTVIGVQIGYLMSGAVVVESVFAIPGMGRLLVNAVLSRDYPVVQGVMLVTVTIFSITNLVVDLLYTVIDPRVGLQ